ncbi:hypothetical protein BST36_24735 [Mycolicibacterium moriokaense]|jgi:hypothetical protein|uniref:O-antigen ligase domain-containing protein n=1 Tax=Mycolicibacterium moriokaense TaxID=39691 RepID=A0AAD1HHB1_9MYCO|nr:hypothetical protein [Mycolicibacterium moriokaense]MCV7042292.1 hypothetical protein [Mycolicibacterium moriokaense]ORB17611.1 hypothetical protein BST36_24735 [Mycolicibacterium moriokaense]BBX05066.1 hypothetical protein MMOR_60020 [Mycolicibacterium moriokaense]
MEQRSRLFITRDAAAGLLIVLMWCRSVGSQIVLSLTAKKVFVPIGNDSIWTPAANVTSKLFFLLAVATCLGIILFRINDVTRPGLWRIAVVLAPWLWILTRDLYSGAPTPDSALYVLVVLALAALQPSHRVLKALGALVVLTAIIAIAFGVLMPDAGIVHEADGTVSQRSDKAVFPSLGLLQGMFTSENRLGLYLAIGAAAVATLPRWWVRLPGLGIVVFAIVWSSSRSSLLAIGCMLAVGIVVWSLVDLGWRHSASAVARIATTAAIVTMCALPLMGWEDEAFTDRALIWRGSLTEWSSRAFMFGLGHDWYERIAGSDTSPLSAAAYQGHNQFVQFLATGGVMLALFALGSLLVQTYATTMPTSRCLAIAAMLVTGIGVSGSLEVPLGFVDRSTFWTVTIVPLMVMFFAQPRDTHQESGAR